MKFRKIIVIFALFVGLFIVLYPGQAQNSSGRVSDVQLLARAINGEARGEPYEGQVAVGAVILNRVKDSRFPNSIAGVIYQPGAFTAVSDGQINVPIDPNSTVVKAAQGPQWLGSHLWLPVLLESGYSNQQMDLVKTDRD